MNAYDRVDEKLSVEKANPRTMEILFDRLHGYVESLPGCTFEHLEPEQIREIDGIAWNVCIKLPAQDKAFPFLLGGHGDYGLPFKDAILTEFAVKEKLQKLMRRQMTGRRGAFGLRYFEEHKYDAGSLLAA